MLFLQNLTSSLNFSFFISKCLDLFILNLNSYLLFIYTKKIWIFNNNFFTKFKFFYLNDYLFFHNKICIFLKSLNILYYHKLRLKGLGFRIRQFSPYLYRFFFTRVNFIYLHIPFNINIKYKGRILYFVSSSYTVLCEVIINIILLKNITIYSTYGFNFPRQLVLMKSGKKRF